MSRILYTEDLLPLFQRNNFLSFCLNNYLINIFRDILYFDSFYLFMSTQMNKRQLGQIIHHYIKILTTHTMCIKPYMRKPKYCYRLSSTEQYE